MIALKMATFILSLGVDTLILAMSLGFVQTKGKLRIALVFACAEAFMPLFGFVIGQTTGEFIGKWTSVIGGVALIAVAIWLIFFDDENDEEEKLRRNLVGWTLVITALSISLDELAVGFSIGFIGVPVGLTICLISIQAFLFTFLGLTFGSRFKPYIGEWSEKLAGIVLGALGLWILIDSLIGLFHS
jgi:putative Mn2+ efflux pump MntP